MSKKLISIEFYNKNYEKNALPEHLVFNLEDNLYGFIESTIPIFINSNNGVLKAEWKKWKDTYPEYEITPALDCRVVRISLHRLARKNLIYFHFRSNLLDTTFITYTDNNNIEKISLRDIVALQNITQSVISNFRERVYDLGEYENILGIHLITYRYNEGKVRLIVKYNPSSK